MIKRIVAVYRDQARAARAASQLTARGFAEDDISILASDSASGQAFMATERKDARKSALTGAAVGTAGGAVVASLAGVGAILTGPIAVGFAGSVAGGLLGGLIGLGIPENEAILRSQEIQDGAILVAIDLEKDDLSRERTVLAAFDSTDYLRIVSLIDPEVVAAGGVEVC
ncbi:MAG: general stress protein [Planctomycetota bacterium]